MMVKRVGIDVIEMVVVKVSGYVVGHRVVVPMTVPSASRRPVVVFVVPNVVEMDRWTMIDGARPAMSVPPVAAPMSGPSSEVTVAAVPLQAKSVICGLNRSGIPGRDEQCGQTKCRCPSAPLLQKVTHFLGLPFLTFAPIDNEAKPVPGRWSGKAFAICGEKFAAGCQLQARASSL